MFNHRIVLKGFLLILILAVVFIVIVTAMKSGSKIDSGQTSQTPTFFEQFVIAGGPIVWFVLLPISLITVYLAVEHSLTIRRKRLLPTGIKEQIIQIINESNLKGLVEKSSDDSDLISIAASKAVRQGKDDWFRMRNTFAESLQEQSWALMRKIEWVNLIGNVSPMVGLFGTVFGMIKLFNAIVTSGGQPQPARLADGISVALVTTFWGLFIAIPALAIFGIFRNRIETFASDAVVEMEEIIPYIQQRMEKRNKNRDQERKSIRPNTNQLNERTSQESAETFSI